jgi:hypothetical protein
MAHPLDEPWSNLIDAVNLIVTGDLELVRKERLEWDGRNYLEHPAAILLFSGAKPEYVEARSWLQLMLRKGKVAISARKGYKTRREIIPPLELPDLYLNFTTERLQLADVDTLLVNDGKAEWRDPLVWREDLFEALAERNRRAPAPMVPALPAPPAPKSEAPEPEPEPDRKGPYRLPALPEPEPEEPEQKPTLTFEALVAFLQDTFASPAPRSNRKTRRERATDHFGHIPEQMWLDADEKAGVKGAAGAPKKSAE